MHYTHALSQSLGEQWNNPPHACPSSLPTTSASVRPNASSPSSGLSAGVTPSWSVPKDGFLLWGGAVKGEADASLSLSFFNLTDRCFILNLGHMATKPNSTQRFLKPHPPPPGPSIRRRPFPSQFQSCAAPHV